MTEETGSSRIIPINIEEEMKSAYIDYSMSVIVSRALPDVRDGMKPVHRRVLFGMQDLGLAANRAHKKSARIVGEVLGKYHPHGDSSVYDTMVRMAQDWSLRYPLVDGQGNFGSIDGDSPAAMRYTEARLRKIAEDMLGDIDKDTVDFQLNFDDTLKEPTVLPTRVPQLLVNGASGIAVGMATNILPHNLSEVIDGTTAYIDNNDIEISELIEYVKAPDFPTGGIVYGYEGVKAGFETGRGKVKVRGRASIEEDKTGRPIIIVTEIPYQVNKANMIKKTADLVNDKKLEGIHDIRDESGRQGMRIVYELKRDANAHVVLNKLYQYTQLQSSYGINNIALVNGKPQLLNLKEIIGHFVDFRHEVVVRRTKYELEQAEKRMHILEGLLIAIDNLDEVIALIRKSANPEEARAGLIERFELSELQAKAILDMRLQKLTGLERDKLKAEFEEVKATVEHLKEILANKDLRMQIIKDELLEIKEKYGDERRSEIIYKGDDISMEDIIADDDMVVTISHLGYMKRTNIEEYRVQTRGGVGAVGGKTRDTDFIEHMFIASAHNYLLLFTESGRCHWLRVYEVPEGSKQSKGRAIQNLLQLDKEDKVRAFIRITDLKNDEFLDSHNIIMATKKGTLKKTTVRAYSRPRVNGINAITIKEGDELLTAALTDGSCEIIMGSSSGYAVRFNEEHVRPMGRTAAGVRGMRLRDDKDEVVGMVCVYREADEIPNLLVVSAKGFGKRSLLDEYRKTNRGTKGVKTINVTDKTGKLIAIKGVFDIDELMIINKSGLTIRMSLDKIRVMGRATQGVTLIKLKGDDEIAAVAKVERDGDEDDEEVNDAEGGNQDGEDSGTGGQEPEQESPESIDEE
ncbi:MAG: DNA gyrase subunit A [Bacteroidetes bacterium]|nr:DNA gyrase subunit A [Bacteroidota bacterium]